MPDDSVMIGTFTDTHPACDDIHIPATTEQIGQSGGISRYNEDGPGSALTLNRSLTATILSKGFIVTASPKRTRKSGYVDISGMRFGRYLVLYRTTDMYGRLIAYVCQCACGTVKAVPAQHLRSGRVQSCGCQKRDVAKSRIIDLAGQRFGRLVVTARYGFGRRPTWSCECDCGTSVIVNGDALRRGATRSCGCLASDQLVVRNRSMTKESPSYNAMHTRVRQARGYAQEYRCYDCDGQAAEWSYDRSDPSPLIDGRIGCEYSVDIDRYQPRCVSCHRLFDSPKRAK